MKTTRRNFAKASVGLAAVGAMAAPSLAFDGPVINAIEGTEEFATAVEAYIFAYPLVTMEMTRRIITNVAEVVGTRGPMGHVIKLRQYPDATFRDVTAPNADTLYTTSFFDVGTEPWILGIPDMKDRFFLFPMLDGWTNVFEVPGKRTTGTEAQTYAITGPGWQGKLPEGVTEYKSPTSIVWLLGRIYCTGTPEDYEAVHALQDQVKLMPLSAYGTDWVAPPGKADASIDMKTPVRDQVNGMDAVAYFTLFCQLMKTNPPSADDAPMLEKLASIGIVPGQDFDASKFNPGLAELIPKIAFARIMLHFKLSDGDIKNINGWGFTTRAGLYGTNYIQRALITAIGLGANRPEDAIYPTSLKPKSILQRSYQGSEKYQIVFKKDQTPPVKGFWSITMYDENYFFVANPLNRYSISARQDLKSNPDGSVTIYIQHEQPGADLESNWLPAPPGKFLLMMRLYWPNSSQPSILDGSWVIPEVTKVG